MERLTKCIVIGILLFTAVFGLAADKKGDASLFTEETFEGLKLRNIGPAFMSGRIADIAVHPEDDNLWYVAVGSGGVWKTTNAGTTWKPVFDDQGSYSIGCVTVDPVNPHTVWVGTGENIGGRHVAYGDGVYRSRDGGATWENMGLKESHHISKIIVHPDNSEILWVAAQGPLWSRGGHRGLYKTEDGGGTWKKTLGDEEWVGVTDIVIDPRNPDWLYAAAWQRHRNVAAYMGGGPGTAIYRSTDGGETWEKLTKGLPKSSMGKIGLAVSPQEPDIVYAAIELDRRTGGVFKSTDRGMSWEKQSDAVSGATGPHYYQELVACPHRFDRLYLLDTVIQISEDGGKTFRRMNTEHKHVDDHALAFRADDPDYLLVGTDGGLYETFDLAENWKYVANLPVTQFYKVALDDAEPFYNIYGGTQDNSSQGGPSRTDNVHGIRNADWFIALGGDGHQPATEPGNPYILYCQSQQGNLNRVDLTTGEAISIRPQPEIDEDFERFNWDAPILVSPHSPTRLYFASQRVWRSENRGDSWTPISGDLTRDQERIALPIMGGSQSWDAAWDMLAMSNYNTITSLAESPQAEGLIYAGTDDGLLRITEDGGATWRKVEVDGLPGVPKTAFVNDIKADLHNANTAYIVLDNHKFGDLSPYILKTTDRGRRWTSIRGNLPDRMLAWRIVQDHVKPDLLFLAAEFGIYFTVDGGERWVKLTGGVPTISFRDLAVQRRENDLVGASFGRGFFVFDDYSVLRSVSEEQLRRPILFPTRKAWWYIPRRPLGGGTRGSQGADLFTSPNPPFGAVFTYYLPESLMTKEAARKEDEQKRIAENKSVGFPGWDAVEAEARQTEPVVWLTVEDKNGNVVRRIKGPTKKGFHRVAWNLRYPSVNPIDPDEKRDDRESSGVMAAPGVYTVTLSRQVDGAVTHLSGPVAFEVVPMVEGALDGAAPREVAAFWKRTADFQKKASAASAALRNAMKRADALVEALHRTPAAPGELDARLQAVRQSLHGLDKILNGYRSKDQVGEKNNPTIRGRLRIAAGGASQSTYGPTQTMLRTLQIAESQFEEFKTKLETIRNETLPGLEKALIEAGAPWVEGQPIPE